MSELRSFITDRKNEIVAAIGDRLEETWPPGAMSSTRWVDTMLDDLAVALERDTDTADLTVGDSAAAREQGRARRDAHDSIATLVRDYAMMCDGVCKVAEDHGLAIAPGDVQAMNLWLDGAMASALERFGCDGAQEPQEPSPRREGPAPGAELAFALAISNAVSVARVSFEALKAGRVGFNSRTGNMLERSLSRIERIASESMERLLPRSGSADS